MKVLMLNYEFPPLGGGGSNACKYILKELSKAKVDVDLVTSSATDKLETEKIGESINVYRLPINKKNIHYWTQKEIVSYSWKARKFVKQLMKERKYDLCHTFFGFPCGAIAYLFRREIPYIVSLRGSDVPGFNKRFSLQYIFLKPIIRRVWRNAAAVIANSQGLKELALKTDRDVKIDIIPNGVNIEEFAPEKNRENGDIIILTVARLIKRKGIDDLIKAVPVIAKAHKKNIKLRIIGEGNMENELKALTQKLKVSKYMDFLGYVPHNEISSYYSSSDIFVLPSRNEGMSNTVLEAMASGLPIITTDTGGTRELINNNGFIVPMKDSEAIKEVIIKYIKNPELIEKHGLKSREIAERMDWTNVAGKYYKIYGEIK